MEKQKLTRAKKAVIRAVCAAVLAVILLAASGFAVVRLVSGAKIRADISDLEVGDYVTTNVDMILGYFAEEYNSKDEDTAYYAVVPYDGKFSVVILPQRYFESADVIFDETYDFINGRRDSINSYVLVTGTAEELSETTAGMFYDWFGLNKDWMTEAGLIDGEVEDYADYLSVVALRGDRVGHVSSVAAWILTAAAWVLLIYAAVVLLRWTLGKYEEVLVAEETVEEAAVEEEPAEEELPEETVEEPTEEEMDEEETDEPVEEEL
jgi:hypothetical protein